MNVQLRPEDEQIVQERLQTGAFSSAEEVIHTALQTLALQTSEDEELRLIANKDIINDEIEAGLAELDRGEGSTEQEVRAWMAEQKQAWRANHGRSTALSFLRGLSDTSLRSGRL